MGTLLIVDLLDKVSRLFLGFGCRSVFTQIDLLFLNGTDDAFGVWVLPRPSMGGHTKVHLMRLQQRDIPIDGVLDAVIRVMDGRSRLL